MKTINHGTLSAYKNDKCRCEDCTEANRLYYKAKREGVKFEGPGRKKIDGESSKERNLRLIQEYKLDKGCADCGYNLHPAALDFDHRDPSEKTFSIGGQTCRSWVSILNEIQKCDVVCANCHRIRTYSLS